MNGDRPGEGEWEVGWDGHERAQRRRLADLPFAEKLRWLEEAQVLVERMKRGGADRAHDEPR